MLECPSREIKGWDDRAKSLIPCKTLQFKLHSGILVRCCVARGSGVDRLLLDLDVGIEGGGDGHEFAQGESLCS